MCSKCKNPDQKATVYCKDCKHYLCQPCYDTHKTWYGLQHDRIATIEDLISGQATLSDTNDQYCTEHEGEEKKFYCETCHKSVCRDCIVLKQCCRDHDTVPIKKAAEKQVIYLNEAVMKCSKKKQECKAAIDKAQTVGKTLSSSVGKVKGELKMRENSYVKVIRDIFGNFMGDVEKLEQESSEKLSKVKDGLSTKLTEIENAKVVGERLSESGSPYEIMSQSSSVLSSLKKMSMLELDKVDDTLANVQTLQSAWILHVGLNWRQIGQIKVPSKSGFRPTGIAVTSDGKIAVCERYHRIHVLSKSGDLMHTIHGDTMLANDDSFRLGGLGDVSITSTNGYVIPKDNQCCQQYDSNYKLLSTFKTYNANKEPSGAIAVTVDKNGCVILGMYHNAISIHNADGSFKSSFAIPNNLPYSVAVTSHDEIVVASYDNQLQLFNYSGKCLLTFDPPPEVKSWVPRYVCCSKKDEVFVSNLGDPKAIYRYAAGGVYIGCVTIDVNDPWGIALSHDDQELYVVEFSNEVVTIFKRL